MISMEKDSLCTMWSESSKSVVVKEDGAVVVAFKGGIEIGVDR